MSRLACGLVSIEGQHDCLQVCALRATCEVGGITAPAMTMVELSLHFVFGFHDDLCSMVVGLPDDFGCLEVMCQLMAAVVRSPDLLTANMPHSPRGNSSEEQRLLV